MKRVLLDSGIVSDLVNRRRDVPAKIGEYLASGTKVGTCVPVVAEIVAGVDMMLSAIALNLENCLVITTESDLKAIAGLDVELW